MNLLLSGPLITPKFFFQENAALCDQVSEIQSNVSKASNERKFLLQRLLVHEPDYTLPDDIADKKTPVRKKSQHQERVKYLPNKLPEQSPPKSVRPTLVPGTALEPYTKARVKIEQPVITPDAPKAVAVKTEPLPLNQFPEDFEPNINSYAIDNLVIQSLGQIEAGKVSFHTDRWIYPVGFTTIRIFGSMANPCVKSVYTCRIAEVAGNPRFEMSSEADPEVMIVGPSPQFCVTTLLNYMKDTHGLDRLASVEPDGNWFFGLGHPVVMSLIEGMPNFGACSKFLGFAKVDNEAAIQKKENDPGINFESFMQLVGGPEDVMFQEEVHEV